MKIIKILFICFSLFILITSSFSQDLTVTRNGVIDSEEARVDIATKVVEKGTIINEHFNTNGIFVGPEARQFLERQYNKTVIEEQNPTIREERALQGDVNGDNITDIITVNIGYIEVIYGCGGRRQYSMPGSYAINGLYDTDGQPGMEIGVVTVGAFKIICDKKNTVRNYNLSGSYGINGTYDTDGKAGDEIGVVTVGAFKIIHDATQNVRDYNLSGSYAINGSYDTNGDGINEIGIVTVGAFRIIVDTKYTMQSYTLTGDYAINGVYDTNGKPGNEIGIVQWGGIKILDGSMYSTRTYNISGSYQIQATNDIDGQPGIEIVVYSISNNRTGVITDRTGNFSWK